MEREVFINDNVIISDRIRNMTPEERQSEIHRLEAEAKKEHERITRLPARKQSFRTVLSKY